MQWMTKIWKISPDGFSRFHIDSNPVRLDNLMEIRSIDSMNRWCGTLVNYNKSYWISSSVHGRLNKRSNAINFFGCSDINEPQSEAKRNGSIWRSRGWGRESQKHCRQPLNVGIVDKSYLVDCKNALIPDPELAIPLDGREYAERGLESQRSQSIIIKYSLEGKWDDNSMNKLHFRNGRFLSPPSGSWQILLRSYCGEWPPPPGRTIITSQHRNVPIEIVFTDLVIGNNSLKFRRCNSGHAMWNRDTPLSGALEGITICREYENNPRPTPWPVACVSLRGIFLKSDNWSRDNHSLLNNNWSSMPMSPTGHYIAHWTGARNEHPLAKSFDPTAVVVYGWRWTNCPHPQ